MRPTPRWRLVARWDETRRRESRREVPGRGTRTRWTSERKSVSARVRWTGANDMKGERVALAAGPTPSPGEGSPESDAGLEHDVWRHAGRASVTPGAGDRAEGAVAAGGSAASGSSAFATPAGRASPATPSGREDDVASLVPSWAWLPRGTEVFALADPARCRPYLSPPVASDEQRAPHVAEPLFFAGDGESAPAENAREDVNSAWRLTEPSEGSPYAAIIKDSTREPFEVRARADWHSPRSDEGTSRFPSPSPSPSYSPASSVATTPRSISGASAFALLTPISSECGDAGKVMTPGFDHPGSHPGTDDDRFDVPVTAAARAPAFASLSVRSAFTKKYLQARRKPPHRLQFYSDRRGLNETWEVVGGATAANATSGDVAATESRAWRPWGVMARAVDALANDGTDVAARRTPGTTFELADDETTRVVDEAAVAKAAFALFVSPTRRRDASSRASEPRVAETGEGKAAIETLAGRSFCVARSRRCPDRALLLVRLRLPTGESPGFDSPGAISSMCTPHRSRRPPRHSAPSWTSSMDTSMRFAAATPPPPPTIAAGFDKIRVFEGGTLSPESPASSQGRSAQSSARFASTPLSESPPAVDAMDIMAMSGKLLKGFALKPDMRRRRSSVAGAFHAWRDVVETERRLDKLGRRATRAWVARRSGRALQAWRVVASRGIASRERLAAALASVAARACAPRLACESRWFAVLASRAWRDVAHLETRRRETRATREHRALALAYASRMSRCFRVWRVTAAVASSSLFSQRRAEAAAGGYLRRLRRASFTRWRVSAQPDTQRRRAAVLDAKLARNESRALFSAVREARRKETLRVFSSQWQRYVARRGVGRAAVALADRVLRRRRETASFRAWRDLSAAAFDADAANTALAEKHDRARTRRVRQSARLRTVRAWRATVSAARKEFADANRAEAFFETVSRRRFLACFRDWASTARASHYQAVGRGFTASRRAERAELFGMRFALRRKRETLAAYRRVVANAVQTRRRVAALIAKRVRNTTYPRFRAWADSASDARRRRAFDARIARRASRRASVRALDAWRDFAEVCRAARRLDRRADAFAKRTRRRETFAALTAWTDAFRYRRSVATFVRLARSRVRRRAATGAFAKWRVAIAAGRALRAAGVVAAARDTRRSARRRFDDWRVQVAEAKRLASHRVRVARARREGYLRSTARRVARGWQRHAETQTRRVRAFFETRAARRRLVAARRATRAWRCAASDARGARAAERRAEAIVLRAAERRAARLKRGALLAWDARAASRAASRRRAARFARRRERAGSARALVLWRARVADVAAARLALDASARRREAWRAATAFGSWRVAMKVARRGRCVTSAAARRRRAARLASTLRAWRARASAKRRERRVVANLAARRASRGVAAALRAWGSAVDASRFATRVVAKARARRARALGASVLGAWHRWAARAAQTKRAALREARVFATLAARRARRALASSLASWRAAAEASRRETRLVAKTALRRTRGSLASAFAAWREAEASAAREKRTLAKMANRWSRRRLVSAFETWLARREATMKRATRARRLERLAARVSARGARDALSTWLDVAVVMKARRAFATRVAQRWIRSTRREVFEAWRDAALGSIRARDAVARFAAGRASRRVAWRVAAAMATWRRRSVRAATFKRRLAKLASGSQTRSLAAAWRVWMDTLARARAVDAAVVGRVSHFARRVRRRRAARAFAALRARSRATTRARVAAEALARSHTERRVEKRFKRWRDVVYRGAYLRALMRRLLSARWTRAARAAFGGWRRIAVRAAAFEAARDTASARFHAARRRVSRRAFAHWRRSADAAARARLAAEKKAFAVAKRAAESETARRRESPSALDAERARNETLAALVRDARAEASASRARAEEKRAEAETLRAVLADRDATLAARTNAAFARDDRGRQTKEDLDANANANAPPEPTLWRRRLASRGGREDVAEAVFGDGDLKTPALAMSAASADDAPLSPPAMSTAYEERRASLGGEPREVAESLGAESFAEEKKARVATRKKNDDGVLEDTPSSATRVRSRIEDETNFARSGRDENATPATSPATSAGSRLDRALRAGAVAEARARRAGAATPEAAPAPEPSRSPVMVPAPTSFAAETPASAETSAADARVDPHIFAAEAALRESEAAGRDGDESVLAKREAIAAAPAAYALVWPSTAAAPPADAAVSVIRADADADAPHLTGRGARDALEVIADRGGVSCRKRHEFERVFWCARDETKTSENGDRSLRRVAAEVSAPMAAAARAGIDATLFVAGGRASGTTSAADAVAAALAAATLAAASARNERFEYLDALAEKHRFRETPETTTRALTTRVVCRFAAYVTRGLVVDDLLAGHAGARGLRVRPSTTRGNAPESRAGTGAGLAYEVEGLSKVEVTSLSQARRLLAACRSRRRDAAKRGGASADAFVCEWWLETVTEITSAAFGVRSRVSRSARSRVVDVRGNTANDGAVVPAFALAQCASAHAARTPRSADADGGGGGGGDWRRSALTKLSKAPLTGEGLVSVLVTLGVANAEAESAETALRFAGAVRGLARTRRLGTPGVARTERTVETSRRERLETKLAATRAEARGCEARAIDTL